MADWLRPLGEFGCTIITFSPLTETCSFLSPNIGFVFPCYDLGIEMYSWGDEVNVVFYMSR